MCSGRLWQARLRRASPHAIASSVMLPAFVARHACATHMHENGADIRMIQAMLGHAKLETTQMYTHLSIKQLQEVHAATHPAAKIGKRTCGGESASPSGD